MRAGALLQVGEQGIWDASVLDARPFSGGPPGLPLELPVRFQVTQDLETAAARIMGTWGSPRATESWGEWE